MTLGRQLAAVTSAIFLVALIGVEALHLVAARAHLQRQLESTAQDAATSLGLSLGSVMRALDPALAETIVRPVFDRGHYSQVQFVSASGGIVVSKALPAAEGAYPGWLPALFPLYGPTAESMVTAGWRQLGKVRVTAHPRFAYEQLWSTARSTTLFLLAIYAAALGAFRLFLAGLLRPLFAIERAAQRISERDFVTLDMRPRTRELERVVSAMNALSHKVNEAIAAEARRAERMQALAYRDEVTALPNAKGFAARFETQFAESGFSGVLALAHIGELAAIDATLGTQACNRLLHTLAQRLEALAGAGGGFAGRWRGALLVVALPALAGAAARERLVALREQCTLTLAEFGHPAPVHVGGVQASAAQAADIEIVLARAEQALAGASAAADGVNLELLTTLADAQPDEAATVRAAIEERRVQLVAQPVYAYGGGLLHTEIMARLRDAAGREMAAAQFMPIVLEHGLMPQLDRAVIEHALAAARPGGAALAINIAIRSLEDPTLVAWLSEALGADRALAARLAFEVPEHGLVQNEAKALEFARAVNAAGARFGIDHFGVHRDSFALLQRLRPAYVKLAAAHTPNLARDAGTRFFGEALIDAARRVEVPVIAQNVEDRETLEALGKLGFAGYQGNVAGRPAPWP